MIKQAKKQRKTKRNGQRGAALAIAIIIVAILAVIAMTALAFSSSEARIAGSDLRRTQTFYAAVAGLEKMTDDFNNLFNEKLNPTQTDLDNIASGPPTALVNEGFSFNQLIVEDTEKLQKLRAVQGLPPDVYPLVKLPDGPYGGLFANIIPYKMSTIATQDFSGTEVEVERDYNNFLVPLFQFGIFSNEDIEIHPGPLLTFNGRIHSNQNIYAIQNTYFLDRVTTAGEFVRDIWRNGRVNSGGGSNNVWFRVDGIDVQSTVGNGSVKAGSGYVGGPNFPGATPGARGYHPSHPDGVANPNWETDSVKPAAAGVPNQFGGMLLTNSTGVGELKMPLELAGNSPTELIKRSLPTDSWILQTSRYHAKSRVRILIDDESAGSGAANTAGIPAGKGVLLSAFTPSVLDGGNALRRVSDSGSYLDATTIKQREPGGVVADARTVRGVKSSGETVGLNYIPPGSGLQGRILIEIVRPDGTTVDVTQEILSLGVTVGEPNGIVYLQRPIWAAYVQGSRDRTGNGFDLVSLTRNYQHFADGEIIPAPLFDIETGYLSMLPGNAQEDSTDITREPIATGYNSVYPINIYNVREGWYESSLSHTDIYERGMMTVIDLNMRNLARWLDGIYDTNLLAGTNAVSSNINGTEGYIVYLSDRRGDKVKTEYLADGSNQQTTNGLVDNEDIYGSNNVLDDGEDVIDFGWDASATSKKGTLQRDLTELPSLGMTWGLFALPTPADRLARAMTVMQWVNPNSYFRRSVRLFDGETLSFSAAAGKLSPTKGITIAAENPVFIWGNYNASGITGIPVNGSTLNDGGYTGPQVPSSIVCDAIFPLSKTWFDGLSAMRPEARGAGIDYRKADQNLPSTTQSSTVRAGIIAGSTLSRINGSPGRNAVNEKLNGGIHNFPRFLEIWSGTPWNFSGSLVPLYRSTQALSQYEDAGIPIYAPPRRNWSFDSTFLTPNKLPPGTPFFQYLQATGFRQKLR